MHTGTYVCIRARAEGQGNEMVRQGEWVSVSDTSASFLQRRQSLSSPEQQKGSSGRPLFVNTTRVML